MNEGSRKEKKGKKEGRGRRANGKGESARRGRRIMGRERVKGEGEG